MTDQEQPAAQRTDDGDSPNPRPAPGPAGRNRNDGGSRPPVRSEDGRSDPTPSFRPIIGERHVGRFEILLRRRSVRGHVGLVLVTQRGEHHGFQPDRQPTTGELLWLGSGTLYEVDTGRHWARVELEVPSRTEAFRSTPSSTSSGGLQTRYWWSPTASTMCGRRWSQTCASG